MSRVKLRRELAPAGDRWIFQQIIDGQSNYVHLITLKYFWPVFH